MKSENFISGIYNYCDRWCERCDFTQQCRVFYDSQEQLKEIEEKDDFVDIISRSLQKSLELLSKIAEEKGIDLDDIEVSDEDIQEEKQKQDNARQHPLTKASQAYLKKTDEWLNQNDHLEEEKVKFYKNIDLGIHLDESDKALRIIDEALNIINWYKFQMIVKLASAIRYYPHNPDFEDEIQNMHHASVKIVLIGIENSMKAWQSLLDVYEDEKDFILDRLLQLHQLKKSILQQFPLVTKFKRPGFDD